MFVRHFRHAVERPRIARLGSGALLAAAMVSGAIGFLASPSPVAAAEAPQFKTQSQYLSVAPTASSPTGKMYMAANFNGGPYVLTVGFYRQIAFSETVQIGGFRNIVSSYPDPNNLGGWEPIFTFMIQPSAGVHLWECDLGIDGESADYDMFCFDEDQGWLWPFDVSSTGTYNWQVSVAPSPARKIGATDTANRFQIRPLQCTWGAQQMMLRNAGKYMKVSGDAWKWASSTNPSGWARSNTPLSRSVFVFSREWVNKYGGITGAVPGHVGWVQGVEYAPNLTPYLHTIEMNYAGHPNQWFSMRRKYEAAKDVNDSYYYMQFILAP